MGHDEEERWEEELSDEDRNPKHKKASWREVVGEGSSDIGISKEAQGSKLTSPRSRISRPTPNKAGEERMYTEDEVIAILKNNKLRGEFEGEEGWTRVNSKAEVKKATSEAREILGVSKKKRKLQCWECKGTDHISTDCPLGISCHYCHKKAIELQIVLETNPKLEEIERREGRRRMKRKRNKHGGKLINQLCSFQ